MSWRQHPTKQLLYGHLPPIAKIIQVRRTGHTGHCWRSKDELLSDIILWTPSHGWANAGWPARTYIQQVCADPWYNLGTFRQQWTIEMDGKRRSGRSIAVAWHDDIYIYIYIYIYYIYIYHTHTCTLIYMYTHTYTQIYIYIYTQTHIYIHTHTHIYIIVILSCCLHGFPWPSLSIHLYCPLLSTDLPGYILYPYIPVVDKF